MRKTGWHVWVAVAVLVLCTGASFDREYEKGVERLEQGRYADAAEHLEAALAKAGEEPQSPEALIDALLALADVYVTDPSLGKEEQAGPLLVRARELADEHLAKQSWRRLQVLERMGSFYVLTGEWEEAREPLESWLDIVARSEGPERAYGSQPASELSTVYGRLGLDEEQTQLRRRIEHPELVAQENPEDFAVAALAPEQLYLAPNVLDRDRTPAFVHFEAGGGPLVVELPMPVDEAENLSRDDTRRAVVAVLEGWQVRLRRVHPSFALEILESAPDADIRIEWRKRTPGYLPAQGRIAYTVENGELRVRGHLILSTRPVPKARGRVPRNLLQAFTLHAFGSALGLPDCNGCDSIMAMDWQRRETVEITDVDLRTFEALLAVPNGQRADGELLLGMAGSEALPRVASTPDTGILADLPFINTGRGHEVQIDLAPPGKPSLAVTLDTGAVESVLTTDYARAIGISVRAIKQDAYRRDTVTGDPLRFYVTGQQGVGAGRGPTHFDYALLGGEFLENYVVDIDFERRRVRFLDPAVHAVDAAKPLPGEQVLELSVREKRPYVKLVFPGGSVWALVDTGAMSPLSTTEDKARTLGIEIDRSGERREYVNVMGHSVSTMQTLPEVAMGSLALTDVAIGITVDDESQIRIARWLQDETLLGAEILEDYRVRFDYRNQKMGLTPIGSPEPPDDAVPTAALNDGGAP